MHCHSGRPPIKYSFSTYFSRHRAHHQLQTRFLIQTDELFVKVVHSPNLVVAFHAINLYLQAKFKEHFSVAFHWFLVPVICSPPAKNLWTSSQHAAQRGCTNPPLSSMHLESFLTLLSTYISYRSRGGRSLTSLLKFHYRISLLHTSYAHYELFLISFLYINVKLFINRWMQRWHVAKLRAVLHQTVKRLEPLLLQF